jgi:hypothetical protein
MAQNTVPQGFVPFTGELDKPTANTAPPGFVPFTGELDEPGIEPSTQPARH